MEKDTPVEEMMQGLLDCMPMGAKTVTYLPAEAVQALSDGQSAESNPAAFKGAYTIDERKWKMPPELKAKYGVD